MASEVVKKTVDGDKVVLDFKLENEEVRRNPNQYPPIIQLWLTASLI